jgi:hypothetical protein
MKTHRNYYPLFGALLCGLIAACTGFGISLGTAKLLESFGVIIPAVWHVVVFVICGGMVSGIVLICGINGGRE